MTTTLQPPTYTQTPVQLWQPGETISFTLPAGTFADPQGEALTYTASSGLDFGSLPSWLSFNSATLTFSGVVPADEPARLSLDVFATNSSGLSTGERILVTTASNPLIAADLSPLVTAAGMTHVAGTPVTLTYSFMSAAPSTQFYTGENNGFQALSTDQQAVVKQALAAYAAVANITFTQAADSSSVNIRFGSDSATAYEGYTAWDPSGIADNAHVMFNNSAQSAYPFAFVVLHEIANTLHLADYSGSTAAFVASFGLPAADANDSYLGGEDVPNSAAAYSPQMGYYPLATPQLLDVQALQFLYGANQTGLTPGFVATSYGRSYQFTDDAAPECIWVGSQVGGTSSLDFSACSGPAIINLNPGSFSSTVASAPASWVTDNAYLEGQAGHPTQNIAIAYGATIQEAIGNNAGDVFYANAASDTLIGGTGNDSFHIGSGACLVEGKGGTDTAVFSDPRADYTIAPDGHGGIIVTETAGARSNGAATLYDVANLQFSDQTIASPLPQVTGALAASGWTTHQTIDVALPANLFTDPQGQALTLTATQADGSALPSWLSFSGTTFSGTVPGGAQALSLAVTATDSGGLAMTDYVSVAIASSLSATAPAALSANEAQATSIAGLQIADSNSQSGSETVTLVLSDQGGTLSAQSEAGGQVSGAATLKLTLSGTLAQVEAELATVTYTGAATASAVSDTITLTASSSLGDSVSQTIAVTDAVPDYLTGALAPAVLSGPGTWHVTGQSTLYGSATSGVLVLAGGATLINQGTLTLGSGTQAGFIGNLQNGQSTHGALINQAGAVLILSNGGIYADSFQNDGTLSLQLDQPSFIDYATGQQTETLTIDAALTNSGTIAISSDNTVGGVVLFEGGGSSSANAFTLGSAAIDSAYLVAIEFGGSAAFTLTGGAFSIYGTPTVLSGGMLDIAATTSFAHGLSVYGAVTVQKGTLVSDYDINGSGTVTIEAGAALQIVDSQLTTPNTASDATLVFGGTGASLILGTPTSFNAPIAGFAAGDTIDLAGTAATAATLSGGDLVISDSGTTIASIPVSGIAAGTEFSVASDGNGGSVVRIGETVSAALASSGSVVVADSAADVSTGLDGLEGLAAAGKLQEIYLTDAGAPALSVTAAQLSMDGAALADISGSFSLTVTAPSSSVSISGLAGHADTVAFSGAAADYTITPTGDGKSFTIAGDGVSDQVSGVTALQFSDHLEIVASKTATAGAVSSAQVASLYAAVLARVPDVGGLAFYEAAAAANPAGQIVTYAEYFLSSAEYTGNATYNYAQTAAGDAQFITDIYANLLHRAPDAGAVAFYQTNVVNPILAGLTAGTTAYANAELLAHATVLTYFSLSAEFLGDVSVTAQHPADATHWLALI